jgi:hypothetical protein
MSELLKAAKLTEDILKATDTMEKATALIQKWSDKELGPNPLSTAASLEARNQVFGWGR